MESTGDEQPSGTNTLDIESEESQPQNQPNPNNELQNNLNELKNLIHGLRNTREPTQLSLQPHWTITSSLLTMPMVNYSR